MSRTPPSKDASEKPLESGASIGLKNTDQNSGIYEDVSKRVPQTTGDKPPRFDEKGAIGKQFTTDGAIGGTAQKIGGPFAETGAIGKEFMGKGNIGGNVQEHLGSGSK